MVLVWCGMVYIYVVINGNWRPRTRAKISSSHTLRPPPRPRPRDVQSNLVDRRHRVRREPVQNALFCRPRLDGARADGQAHPGAAFTPPFESVVACERGLELDVDALDDACCFEIDEEPVGAGDGRALHVFGRLPSILQPVVFEAVRDHRGRSPGSLAQMMSLVYCAISISSAGAASAAASGRCSAPTASAEAPTREDGANSCQALGSRCVVVEVVPRRRRDGCMRRPSLPP